MKRPLALRVRESIDRYVPMIQRLEPHFQEFSELIEWIKVVVHGLANYHWWFTSDEHRKLILTMRKEDVYSLNVTLIGRQLMIYATSSELTLRQKKFLDRMNYILGRCLKEALELFEESEEKLARQGIRIYMDASDGYGEYEMKEASLWIFQKEFHKKQLDSSRGSSKAIIYPATGFEDYRICPGIPELRGKGTLNDEEKLLLRHFIESIGKLDGLRDVFSGNKTNTDDDQPKVTPDIIVCGPGEDMAPPVIPPPTVPTKPTKPPTGILVNHGGGTFGLGTPLDGGGRKHVHWRDSDNLPLPSPDASGGPPAGNVVGDANRPSIPNNTFRPPSTPTSPSSSEGHPTPTPHDPTPSNSTNDPTVPGAAGLEDPNHQPPPTSPSSLPSVGSSTPINTPSSTEDEDEDDTTPNPQGDCLEVAIGSFVTLMVAGSSNEDGDGIRVTRPWSEDDVEFRIREFMKFLETVPNKGGTDSSMHEIEARIRRILKSRGVIASTNATPAEKEVEVRSELALSMRAYLGRRHDEYSIPLSALSTEKDAEGNEESEGESDFEGDFEGEDDDNNPLDPSHPTLEPIVRQKNSSGERDVKTTALLHWSGVTKNKRQERINGYTYLRAFMKWAEKKGRIPLSPSSIRATTGLRRGLFEPLGPPDLSLVRKHEKRKGADAYREATLANLAQMQPRLDLTLRGFLFNQDALRLFGGLVGERPQPRDLGRMDKLLRELEVYNAVCKHRKDLIVWYLKAKREFPTAMAAQFGDLQAALLAAEEDHLSAAQRCFNHVASRSKRVMTYPGKRRMREFSGVLSPEDREKLDYLSEIEDEAEALRDELVGAEDWLAWCKGAIEDWTKGWPPVRVEKDMLYVGEDAQADLRRYKWEINQKRVAIGLVPVERPQDEVYKRQQDHIERLDRFWSMTTSLGTDQ